MWHLVAIVAFALCYSPLPWPRPQPVKYKCPTSLKTTKQDWMQPRNDYTGWSWYKSQQEGYRRLRVEHGDKVKQVWEKFERKEIEGRDLKAEIARALAEDVQSSLLQPTDPETLEQKARTPSNNKRGALPQHDREHLVRDMDITAHLEWVRKDKSGAIALILKRGEPSRLHFERIRHDGNWALFVASRMQEPPKGIQIYPDRGPQYQGVKVKEKVKEVQPPGAGAEAKGRERGARATNDGSQARHACRMLHSNCI